MKKNFISRAEKETLKLGRLLGENLRPGDILGLIGELGSGKTILVKGIAQGLGIDSSQYPVRSPSFVIIKEYPGPIFLYHFDLYRLDDLGAIERLGFEDYLRKEGVIVIEWADKMEALLPKQYLRIELEIAGKTKRRIRFLPFGERYRVLIKKLNSMSFCRLMK